MIKESLSKKVVDRQRFEHEFSLKYTNIKEW